MDRHRASKRLLRSGLLTIAVLSLLVAGCGRGPTLLPEDQRRVIDRQVVEYPTGFVLTPYIDSLTAPIAMAFVQSDDEFDDALLIAESGIGGHGIRIFGFKADGTKFELYSGGRALSFLGRGSDLQAPIGGMTYADGEVFVTHRDADGNGVVSAFRLDGTRRTVVGGLPAKGDHSVTDIVYNPANGRLYFGLGSATNSGVVGIDNWEAGWVEYFRDFCDQPYVDLKLLGYRFDTPNPRGGIFGGDDKAVSAPFQPFATSNQVRIRGATNRRPTSAIFSVSPDGGDLRVEAHGIRRPAGLVFNEFGSLFATNNGMELRGTRPVKDDPDVVLRVPLGGETWFGFPDFSADLLPISDPRFQPPVDMIIQTGYPELSFLIDHATSGLTPPDRNTLLRGVFPSLSGAAKMAVVRERGAFRDFRGNIIVALSGDRAPHATSGRPLVGPIGYRVVRVDPDTRQVREFVFNPSMLPASRTGHEMALERPVDVKFGPDGALYILDFGEMTLRGSEERVTKRTGRIYRLAPEAPPTTQP